MELPESKIKWVAGLSNGETLIEGLGVTSFVKGEDSPWWKLQKYLKDNNLKVNSLYLSYKDRHFHLPSINPKFGGEKPVGYNCFRQSSIDAMTGEDLGESYICAEAIYKDYKVQLWVDENNTDKVWVNLAEIK